MKLDELVKKIGKAVEESKPYWEARRLARQVSKWCRDGGRWKHSELLFKVLRGARPRSQVDSWVHLVLRKDLSLTRAALVLLSSNTKSQGSQALLFWDFALTSLETFTQKPHGWGEDGSKLPVHRIIIELMMT